MATKRTTNSEIPQLAEQVVQYLGQHPEMLSQFVDHPYSTVQTATQSNEKLDRTDMSQLLTAAASLATGQTQSASAIDAGNLATLAGNLLGQNNNSIHGLASALFGVPTSTTTTQTTQTQQTQSSGLDLGSLVSMATLAGGLLGANKKQQQAIDLSDGLDAAELATLAGSFLGGQSQETAAQKAGIDLGTVASIASLFLGGK